MGTVHTISKSLKAIEKTLTGSTLLTRGRLDVRATTEAYREWQIREEIEDHQRLKGHIEALKVFTPSDAGLEDQERRAAEQEAEFQRRTQNEAVEPVLRQVRRARHAAAWIRRHLRERKLDV